MKVLVVLSAIVASCLATSGSFSYGYSALSPLSYNLGYAPYANGYSGLSAYSPLIPTTYAASYAAPLATSYAAPLATSYAAPLATSYAAPLAVSHAAPLAVATKSQYHSQNEAGEAAYGHDEPHQSHHAIQDAHGNKVGSFSYTGPHGEVHKTDYVADALGYRAAANDLPVEPLANLAAKAAHLAAKASAGHYRRKRSLFSSNVHGWGIPAVLANGHIADTPEVAAAKASHFAEVAKASGHTYAPAHAPAYTSYAAPAYTSYAAPSYSHAAPSYGHYQPANIVVKPDGFLADTPEVAAAKNAHLAEKAKASGHYAPAQEYYGHAAPAVTHGGYLADTPEVAAAKAAHFAEKAKVSGHYAAPAYTAAPSYAQGFSHAHGPWGIPYVKADGFLADTPEVAAAKSAHLAELHARGKRSVTPASTTLSGPIAHSDPLAYSHAPAYSSLSYSALPYTAALPYTYAPSHGIPAVETIINHNPGHAVSYRTDAVSSGYHY